ncbi:6818_t:CDS:2 [Rhizophagus irregularis]|nr:6818_t:CDS:2 [Rhizophagus irregularis]
MTKLASTSFEFNMVTTEDNSSDISEEIDELAGDLEFDSNHNETPNNDKRGSIQYMIKWKGYPDKHNSWVSKEHVYAEQKESEYWNNKEIEAKEKIKSLVDKHNINAILLN